MLNIISIKNIATSLSNSSNVRKSLSRKFPRAQSTLPEITNHFKFSISTKKNKHQTIKGSSLPMKNIKPNYSQLYLSIKQNPQNNFSFSTLRFRTIQRNILPRNYRKKQVKKIKVPSMFSIQKKVYVKFKEIYSNIYYNKNANLTFFDLYIANNIILKKKCRINVCYSELKYNNIFEEYLFDYFLRKQSYILRRFLLFFIYNKNIYSYNNQLELEFLKNKTYPRMVENFINLIISKKSTLFSYSILYQIINNIKHIERRLKLNNNSINNNMEIYFPMLKKITIKTFNNCLPNVLLITLNSYLRFSINNYINKKQKETRKGVINIFHVSKGQKSFRNSKSRDFIEDDFLLEHCYSLDSIDESYNLKVKKYKLKNSNSILLKSKSLVEKSKNKRNTNDSEVKDIEKLIKNISVNSNNILNNNKNNENHKKIIQPRLIKNKINTVRKKNISKSVIYNFYHGMNSRKAKILYNYFMNKNSEISLLGAINQTLLASHNKCNYEFKKVKDFVTDKRNNDKNKIKFNKIMLKKFAEYKIGNNININTPSKMIFKNNANLSDYTQHTMFDDKNELKNNISRAEYHDFEFKTACTSYLIMRKANKQNIELKDKDRKFFFYGSNFKQMSKSADIYL